MQIERADGEVVSESTASTYYNPTTGVIRSNDTSEIALWMVDTNYDEESSSFSCTATSPAAAMTLTSA